MSKMQKLDSIALLSEIFGLFFCIDDSAHHQRMTMKKLGRNYKPYTYYIDYDGHGLASATSRRHGHRRGPWFGSVAYGSVQGLPNT
jgi:hypothetical protein